MPGIVSHTVYVDLINRKFILTDRTYQLASYGDVVFNTPIGFLKETSFKITLVANNKKWVDYSFSLKNRIDTAVGTALDLAAYDLESINQEHGFRCLSNDEDIRRWLKSTPTYQSL